MNKDVRNEARSAARPGRTSAAIALVLALATALTAAGCGDEMAPTEPGSELDYPAAHGALNITVESTEPIAAAFTGRLRLYQEPTDFTESVAEREFGVAAGTRSVETIYVEAGSYAVVAEVLDEEGFVVMAGLKEAIRVLPSMLTPVAIELSPPGGVQVEVSVELGGDSFELDPTVVDDGRTYTYFVGTQRLEDVSGGVGEPDYRLRYHALASERYEETWTAPGGFPITVVLFRNYSFSGSSPEVTAASDELLDDAGTLATGIPNRCQPLDMTSAGDRLYVACRNDVNAATLSSSSISIHSSLDGRSWSPVGTTDSNPLPYDCAFYVDDQYDLLCATYSLYDLPSGTRMRAEGLFNAVSRDGVSWSPLPPISDEVVGHVVFDTAIGPPYQSGLVAFRNLSMKVLGVQIVGGVYVGWLAVNRRVGSQYESYVYRMTSTDRVNWSETSALEFNGSGTVFGEALPTAVRRGAVFQTVDGYLMIFADASGHLRLARER